MTRGWLLKLVTAIQFLAGAAIVAYCIASGGRLIPGDWFLGLIFVGGGIASARLPISVVRAGSRAEMSAETLFVVACALALPTQVGTLSIASGAALGFVLRRDLTITRIHDIAGTTIGSFLALVVAHSIGGSGFQARDLLGAVTAGLLYDPVTLLFVALTIHMSTGRKFWRFVGTCLSMELPVWPFLVCCGVLLGALANSYQWTLVLATAPLGLIFLASKARVTATEDRARLDGLLNAATAILESTTIAAVLDAVSTAVDAVFDSRGGRIDTDPAREGELSTPFVTEKLGEFHLVVGKRAALMTHYTEQDQRLLETLASITVSAFDKAAQHEDATLQARLDPLTGLNNRRSFEEQVRTTLMGMRSSDGAGIIFADLDGFKKVNDVHGHKAGDEVLVQTAARLSGATRGGDVVARLGGDEFTILLRGVHTAADAIMVAQRVLEAMRQPIVLSSGAEVHTTPSVGIALALQPGAEPVTLLQAADAAMYEAKRAGKDCWRLAGADAATTVATPDEGVA